MADFRRCILALAVVALFVSLVPMASAQTGPGTSFQCVASTAVPPLMRAEGLTELTGDIVLACNGGVPFAAGDVLPTANITVFMGAPVTSRLVSGGPGNSDIVLMVDDPGPTEQNFCAAALCTVTSNGDPNQFKNGVTNETTNVWQGTVSGNAITFNGIPVDPPGSQNTRVYRITNVRVNAQAAPGGANGIPGAVIAVMSATPATPSVPSGGGAGVTLSFPISNPTTVVGYVQQGMTFASGSVVKIKQCNGATGLESSVSFTEGFATAFKVLNNGPYNGPDSEVGNATTYQDTPGLVYGTESGFYSAAVPVTSAADAGTRLMAMFAGIPQGVKVYVSIYNAGAAVPAVARLVANQSGGFSPVSGSSMFGDTVAPVTLDANGNGNAIWEVLSADPTAKQKLSFNVYFSATPDTTNNLPAPGTGNVSGSFAPISTVTGFVSGPIPRFVQSAANGGPIVTVNVCRTNLLFPYVTSQAGFDTGLAISNTSMDPFGTPTQTGDCTMYFYGANAPSAVTTPTVTPGTTFAALASSDAPNFSGYVIATCNFQYAHGFAFVSDLGARNLAMGYLALIIPDPPRSPNPFPSAGASSGEQLGY